MRSRSLIVTLAWAALLVNACASTRIPVTERDLDLLKGHWAGVYERRSAVDGQVSWREQIGVDIRSASQGQLTRSGGSWTLPIAIRNGRVFFSFDGAERGFELRREPDGGLVLEMSYYTESEYGPRIATITVKKVATSPRQ